MIGERGKKRVAAAAPLGNNAATSLSPGTTDPRSC
jgi:hypothetical protein